MTESERRKEECRKALEALYDAIYYMPVDEIKHVFLQFLTASDEYIISIESRDIGL